MRSVNPYIAAFKESYNTIGLAATVAASVALLNPLPLLAGVVVEVAYLAFVPDSKWYEARLARRFDAEVEQRRRKLKDQTLPTLRPEMQERFLQLEQTRKQIDTESQDDKAWFREVVRKLDYLLEKFLLFASKEAQFRSYLQLLREEIHTGQRPAGSGALPPIYGGDRERRAGQSSRNQGGMRERSRDGRRESAGNWNASDARRSDRAPNGTPQRPLQSDEPAGVDRPPGDGSDRWVREAVAEVQAHYEQERASVDQLLQTEQDEDTKAVLVKRADVLQRRQEFAGKIGKILTNIDHQLQLVEDTFGLINDEIRARSPEQILADIEEVVIATNTMATALEELAPLEQMAARAAD